MKNYVIFDCDKLFSVDYVFETENSIEISCTTCTKVSVNNGVSRESLGTSVIMTKSKSNAFGQVREVKYFKFLKIK